MYIDKVLPQLLGILLVEDKEVETAGHCDADWRTHRGVLHVLIAFIYASCVGCLTSMIIRC